MKKVIWFCLLVMFSSSWGLATERLAIAEPVGGEVSPTELKVLWSVLETTINSDQYEVVTRSAFNQMLTEIGLVNQSGLVDFADLKKAELGKIKGVDRLLITQVAKVGDRINLSLMVMNPTTGTIVADQKINESYKNFDEMINRLEDLLRQINLVKEVRNYGMVAMLCPKVLDLRTPDYVKNELNLRLQNLLLDRHFRMYHYQAIKSVLAKNHLDPETAEPAEFSKIGKVLRVDTIFQPSISRFEFTEEKRFVKMINRMVIKRIGVIEGDIKVIKAANGELEKRISFKKRVNFSDVPLEVDTSEWCEEDYQNYLLDQALNEIKTKI